MTTIIFSEISKKKALLHIKMKQGIVINLTYYFVLSGKAGIPGADL